MLRECRHFGAEVILIDNSADIQISKSLADLAAHFQCGFYSNHENMGLASALNSGVGRLIDIPGIRYLLFLDQDSAIDQPTIAGLIRGFRDLEDNGICVGAVGPAIVDAEKPAREHGFHLPTAWIPQRSNATSENAVECETLNCSGILTSIEVIEAVGGFEERLFVDLLDAEWSFRARSKGYRLYGLPGLRMRHHMGQQRFYRRMLSRWPIPYRSPLRHYYYYRNIFLLRKLSHMPRAWRFWSFINLLRTVVVYLIIAKGSRCKHLEAMLKGATDGLRGFSGIAPKKIQSALAPYAVNRTDK